MADLSERLRRIETAPSPDLWSAIAARASEGGPTMDTNVTSIEVFRREGWERRRRLTAGLVAAAVFALTVVVVVEAFRPATTVPAPPASLPEGWVRCTNSVLGYSIGYPGTWYTTDMLIGQSDPANACQWFSPQPFDPKQGNGVMEGWGYPLEVGVRGPFEQALAHTTDPELAQVLLQEELTLDGHRAVRLEYETVVDLIADTGLHYAYVVELDADTTLVVHTTETRGIGGDYEVNKARVDEAADTLRFAD